MLTFITLKYISRSIYQLRGPKRKFNKGNSVMKFPKETEFNKGTLATALALRYRKQERRERSVNWLLAESVTGSIPQPGRNEVEKL